MAKESSFDIVSKVELPEVQNAIQTALKEIGTRYDFKGSKAASHSKETSSFSYRTTNLK